MDGRVLRLLRWDFGNNGILEFTVYDTMIDGKIMIRWKCYSMIFGKKMWKLLF